MIETVLAYHERTKHQLDRYARALGYLDWATQPDPFRTYAGAEQIPLPLAAAKLDARYEDLYRPGAIAPRPAGIDAIGVLFELSLGLSAWKEHRGARWALRCNPSSGNLHPTEGYLVTAGLPEIAPGVYHYTSYAHALERRSQARPRLPAGAFLVALTSIHWREAWKYGERAYRYCQHDAGHALAAVRYAARALGWSAFLLDGLGDDDLSRLLGLDEPGSAEAEREDPDLALLVVGRECGREEMLALAAEVEEGIDGLIAPVQGAFEGHANRLSFEHHPWPIIGDVARAARKPRTTADRENTAAPAAPAAPGAIESGSILGAGVGLRAAGIIQTRRSALDFDGKSGIPAAAFYRMLARILPSAVTAPWDALTCRPRIHLGIFVHRVEGLDPGLYFLPRDSAAAERLRGLFRPEFAWKRPQGCPEGLDLRLLAGTDATEAAKTISCHQDIAADGAFSLGMLAEFEGTIRELGPWRYRTLFWEAGFLGQVLYLEAEALGVRATGIGCYFDDAFHQVLGLDGTAFQDLYHFTVGTPVEDLRLKGYPPYGHLKR